MLQRLLRSPHARSELEVGCLWPVALMLAVAIAVGVVVGMTLRPPVDDPPRVVNVRVIDDGAKPGPKVVSTHVIPLR